MIRLLLAAAVSLFFFLGCQSDKPGNARFAPAETDLSRIGDSLIYFSCNDITQPSDQTSHFELFLTINESKVKVGDVEVCEQVDQARYEELQIPKEALGAVGGEVDGAGNYYYAIRTETNKLVVRQGTSSGDSLRYRAIATFTDNDLSINPQLNKADLVGVYAAEGRSTAYVLFMAMFDKGLQALLFEFEGKLPQGEEIGNLVTQHKPEVLAGFVVNMADLTFDSDQSSGKFIQNKDGYWTMVFDNKKDDQGKKLVLQKAP